MSSDDCRKQYKVRIVIEAIVPSPDAGDAVVSLFTHVAAGVAAQKWGEARLTASRARRRRRPKTGRRPTPIGG
jgi:hypothetical protein